MEGGPRASRPPIRPGRDQVAGCVCCPSSGATLHQNKKAIDTSPRVCFTILCRNLTVWSLDRETDHPGGVGRRSSSPCRKSQRVIDGQWHMITGSRTVQAVEQSERQESVFRHGRCYEARGLRGGSTRHSRTHVPRLRNQGFVFSCLCAYLFSVARVRLASRMSAWDSRSTRRRIGRLRRECLGSHIVAMS